ncbi:MAG: signal peptidase II [Verrucomicrobiota bacterium]
MKAVLYTYRLLITLALVILVSDQVTKFLIVQWLPEGTYHQGTLNEPVVVIPNFFYIVHITNDGAAWGLFEGYTTILGLLGLVAIGFIIGFRKSLHLERPLMQVCFGLLIGGILGNMIDRFVYGHVVDFLDFHFGTYRYPSFNIADSGITVGVAIYVIATLFEGRGTSASSPQPDRPQ